MNYEFLFDFVPTYLPRLLQGALVTIQISLLSFVFATIIGLCLALGRLSSNWPLVLIVKTYVNFFRGIPLIVSLLIIYFTLPTLGIKFSAFWAGTLGLSLNLGAYLSEVFRAAIQAIPSGQHEASSSLGLSTYQRYRLVVLPQALSISIPTVGGYFIALLKECALVSYISVNELLRTGTEIIGETFRSMEVYVLIGAIYLVLSYGAAMVVAYLERVLKPAYLSLKPTSTPKAPLMD